MKKAIIASAVALATLSGAANANNAATGIFDLNFVGTVSQNTCALEVDGAQNNSMTINLEQAKVNSLGKTFEIVFKPTAASAADCAAATTDFVMQWNGVGSQFETGGLKAASGAAADSHVQIKATNAKTNNNTIVETEGYQYEFTKDNVTGDGLKYEVALMGGSTVGDMTAAATVKHWYK
ncbi:hypothetical protein [Escherichia coli]|uniref:hypothetical protein n=1 Tax=Escherichia coli TaxID=562 RepID=UPI000B800365|nr:hypothetical protein [Escherichia coli]